MKNRFLHILLLIILVAFSSRAQILENDTRTQVADSRFKSLQVKLDGNDYFPPIITLNSEDKIRISFDELDEDMPAARMPGSSDSAASRYKSSCSCMP